MIHNLTPTRHYNSLLDKGDYFIKSSVDIDKIAAEIKYYENLPKTLETFYPNYLGRSDEGKWPTGYKIEKILENDLSMYFIDKVNASMNYFDDMFDLILKYIEHIPKKRVTSSEFHNAFEKQIFQRDTKRINALTFTPLFEDVLKIFQSNGFKNIEDFTNKLHTKISKLINSNLHLETWYSHGDLCFSNIIIHNNKFKLIDPRGIYHNTDESYLVPYYDLAKLSQCIYGGYDFINNDLDFDFKYNFDHKYKELVNSFGLHFNLCRLVESSHFLAMLPLHVNNKKKVLRFAQRAIDVFKEIK